MKVTGEWPNIKINIISNYLIICFIYFNNLFILRFVNSQEVVGNNTETSYICFAQFTPM